MQIHSLSTQAFIKKFLSFSYVNSHAGSETVKCPVVDKLRGYLSWQTEVGVEWVSRQMTGRRWWLSENGWVDDRVTEWEEGQVINSDKILEYHIFQPFNSRCGFPLNTLQVSYLPSLCLAIFSSLCLSLCVCV